MKKTLIVLMVALLIPAAVFAGRGGFDLIIGAVAKYNYGLGEMIDEVKAGTDPSPFLKLDNYQFGPELRIRLAIVEIDAGALMNTNGSGAKEFYKTFDYSGYGNVGLSFDLLGFIRLGVTAGLDFAYKPTNPEGKQFIIGPSTVGDTKRQTLIASMEGGAGNMANWALTAPINVRATVDFLLGDAITLGVNAVLPTNLSIAAISDGEAWKAAYKDATTNWKATQVGIYLGFNLI